MASRRIKSSDRAPSAVKVAVGWMDGYRLTFDKVSADGSGKCDCEHTENSADRAYGVVFRIAQADAAALDRAEGLGHGYEKRTLTIATNVGALAAIAYLATSKRPDLRPYAWYKEHVLRGAREHGLPADYARAIEGVEAKPDSDQARAAREMAIWSTPDS